MEREKEKEKEKEKLTTQNQIPSPSPSLFFSRSFSDISGSGTGLANPSYAELLAIGKDLTAGTIGACVGIVVGQPLDFVKVRLQSNPDAHKSILSVISSTLKHESPLVFFKGLLSPLLGNAPINAIVFGCTGNGNRIIEKYFPLEEEKNRLKSKVLVGLADEKVLHRPRYWQTYAAASYAGAVQCIVAVPVELVKCQMQTQRRESKNSSPPLHLGITNQASPSRVNHIGTFECARSIYRHYGVAGLYRGWWVTFWPDAPSYGVWFVTFEWLKYNLTHLTPSGPLNSEPILQPSMPIVLFSGGVAGIATWTSTFPFDTIKTVIQTLPASSTMEERRILRIGREIWSKKGWRGFFKGWLACSIRAFPVSAVTFLVYGKLLSVIT